MSQDIAALIEPIDWENCKAKFPMAAQEFQKALEPLAVIPAERKLVRKAAYAARKDLTKLIETLDNLPSELRYTVFHSATVWFDHEKLDIGPIDFREALEGLERGFENVLEDINFENKDKHPAAHAICAAFCTLYTLDTGTHPGGGNKGDGSGYSTPFLQILDRILVSQGILITDLVGLSKRHREAIKRRPVAEIQRRYGPKSDQATFSTISARRYLADD